MTDVDRNLKHGSVPRLVAITILVLVSLVILIAVDDALADRFIGGGFDGYDTSKNVQTSYYNGRFKGGGYDGFDNGNQAGHKIPDPPGMIFMFF